MSDKKIFVYEKIIFLIVLVGSLVGFWYFEESVMIKIFALILASSSVILSLRTQKKESNYFASKFELASLLILYLGIFALYNLLYNINLPLYIVMAIILLLVLGLVYSTLTMDGLEKILTKNVTQLFSVLVTLVILQIFLALHFWPIAPEAKSLIIVTIFFLLMSLIYLFSHNMLRLKRTIGYLIISIVILGTIIFTTWLNLPK